MSSEKMYLPLAVGTKAENIWKEQMLGTVAGTVLSRLQMYDTNLRRFDGMKRIK